MIFHREFGFPKDVPLPTGRLALDHTLHAKEQAAARGINIPLFVTLKRYQIIEITVSQGRVHKFLIRGSFDEKNDLCMVILCHWKRGYLVKTAWLNSKNDNHPTLNPGKYDKP